MGSLNLFKKLVQVSLFCSILFFPSAFYCAETNQLPQLLLVPVLKKRDPNRYGKV